MIRKIKIKKMENGEKKKEKKKIMKFRRKMEERGQFSGIYVVVLHGFNATIVAIVASPRHASPWSSLLLLVHYSSCVPFIGFLRHCAHKECKSHKHVSKLHAQTKHIYIQCHKVERQFMKRFWSWCGVWHQKMMRTSSQRRLRRINYYNTFHS